MNEFFRKLYNRVPPFLRNKYILTLVIFIIWIILFDNNNLIDRFHDMKQVRQLERDKDYYQERIDEDSRKLNELRSSDEKLEKFAREQYHMKKDNEDLYIILSKDEEREERKKRK